MNEIMRIVEVYQQVDFRQRKAALATVVRLEGSSYRRPGARMLITDDGRWEGAISGGCLEGDALRKARQVMLDGQPTLIRYDTMDDEANSLGVGLGCNGIIDVLIEPLKPTDPQNPVAMLADFGQQRDRRVIATVFGSTPGMNLLVGSRFVLRGYTSTGLPGWLAPAMTSVMVSGKPQSSVYEVAGGRVDVLVERIDTGIELVIFGAGYDTIPLVRLATEMGWRMTVTEDCIAHLSPKRFPPATCLLYADAQAVTDQLVVTDRTAAVVMSHNYRYDLAVLTNLLATAVPYIGLLGPRKRFEKMQEEWRRSALTYSEADYQRVHAPVGLDIGAETPEEIALSIVAEIKAFFSDRSGGFLTALPGPIHKRPTEETEIGCN